MNLLQFLDEGHRTTAQTRAMFARMRSGGGVDKRYRSAASYGDSKGTTPGPKDLKRLTDILHKSAGDPSKAVQLATRMAGTITDKDKALRRAKAARTVHRGALGKIISGVFTKAAKGL